MWRNVRKSATPRSLFDSTQITLGLKPWGAIRPALLMARKTAPSVLPVLRFKPIAPVVLLQVGQSACNKMAVSVIKVSV